MAIRTHPPRSNRRASGWLATSRHRSDDAPSATLPGLREQQTRPKRNAWGALLHLRAVLLGDRALFLFDLIVDLARRPQPQVGLAALKRRHVHDHHIADVEARLQHALGQRVFDQVGDDPA